MSKLFCEKFANWVKREIDVNLDTDLYGVLEDHDMELIYIMKRSPEWLAEQFGEFCKKDKPNYREEIQDILLKFVEVEKNVLK